MTDHREEEIESASSPSQQQPEEAGIPEAEFIAKPKPDLLDALTSRPFESVARTGMLSFLEGRLVFAVFIFGVLIPISSFAAAAVGLHWVGSKPWQSGNLQVYMGLLIGWPAAAAFYPVYLYSAVCLALWCWDRKRFAEWFAIRFGIFCGGLLSIQGAVLVYTPSGDLTQMLVNLGVLAIASVISGSMVWGFSALVYAVTDPLTPRLRNILMVVGGLLFVIYVVGIVLEFPVCGQFAAFIGLVAPMLSLFAYWWASRHVIRNSRGRFRFSIMRLMGVVTWACAFFASWRNAIRIMMVEYQKLPTEDPNCFVCSAAAHGYPGVTRAKPHRIGGRLIHVSLQMKRLKVAEFALASAAPRLHQRIREIYNSFGPPLAKMVRRRVWLSTMAFLAFKPLELAVAILFWLIGIKQESIRQIYR